jgi:sarcosine oxidase subunit gamma
MSEPVRPRSALEKVYARGQRGNVAGQPGVVLCERRNVGIVQVSAFDAGEGADVRDALGKHLGLSVPEAPDAVTADGKTTVLWGGPKRWLVVWPDAFGLDLSQEIASALGELPAAVVDVGSGRTVLRVSGPRARYVLAKGCTVDLRPEAFAPGTVRLTAIGHYAAALHLVDDAPTFDVIVARGFAQAFWEWLCEASREVGYSVEMMTS